MDQPKVELNREAEALERPGPKRVMVLTADAGFGHRSAAKAIAAALKEQYGPDLKVFTVNPLNSKKAPALLRNSQADYDKQIRQMPELYRLGYRISDKSLSNVAMESGLTVLLFDLMRKVLRRYKPDVIVATYPLYLAPLDAVFTVSRRDVPLLTVVTDLATLQRLWFNRAASLCLVPTQAAHDLAVESGLSPDSVQIIGIPVHPALAQGHGDKASIRAELGWQPDLTTVLVAGSKRVPRLAESLRVLDHSGLPLQLVVVAGGDDDLYRQLQNTEWHTDIKIYNFMDNMPTLMQAADCIICKAGGLIVTESLAIGLPLVLISVLPGQEQGNADHVIRGGAGELAENPLDLLEVMYHWLENDGELLAQRAENARRLGRPQAAHDIAELVWGAAQGDLDISPKRHLFDLPNLINLLDRFNVPWSEDDAQQS